MQDEKSIQAKKAQEEQAAFEKLTKKLKDDVQVLRGWAANYFSSITNPHVWEDEERYQRYDAFRRAYVKLYEQLNNIETSCQADISMAEKKALVQAADTIAINTTVLLKAISKQANEVAAPYDETQKQQQKVMALQKYQQQYHLECELKPVLRKFARVVTGLVTAAAGFVAGLVVGAFWAIKEAFPFSLLCPPVGVAVAGVGAVIGGVVGAKRGYELPKQCALLTRPKAEKLHSKASQLADKAVAFFPKPSKSKEEKLRLLSNRVGGLDYVTQKM